MNPYELYKCLYNKNQPDTTLLNNINMLIGMNKWLSTDKRVCGIAKRIVPFLFYINPLHYYYLLYFSIPKQAVPQFYKIAKSEEIKEDPLVLKIKHVLGWSNADIEKNKEVLKRDILGNRKYWCDQLGVEK